MRFLRKLPSYLHHLLVQVAFVLFDKIVPVRLDSWCFTTWDNHPHTLDNPRAVFERVKDDPSLRKVVLQKTLGSGPGMREGRNVVFVPAESLRGAYHLARSRVVLLGYALRGISSYGLRVDDRRHHIIQLWHGIPLKRIGKLFPGDDFWDQETGRYAATVCSSEQDREMMLGAFAPVPRERVWLTGLPRNDFLLMDQDGLPGDYRDHLERLDERLDGRRLVLYAPTWRKSSDAQYGFSAEETRVLHEILERHGAVLGIRGHANVRHRRLTRGGEGDVLLLNTLPDVNVILRRTDVLVTDYSSIYIDFLLLDRPVIHFAYDLESYRAERGFLYEPEEAFAGPTVGTSEELAGALDRALQGPEADAAARARARALFHSHGIRAQNGSCAQDVVHRIQSIDSEDPAIRTQPEGAYASP